MKSIRILAILAAVFFLAGLTAHAQADETSGAVIPDRNYQLLRGDEDWSFLRDPALRQDFWDPIKYIPLRRNSPDWYLTISGEAREVWEQTGNNNWGEQPFWNNFFLERYMLGFDAHYGKHFRTFVEFKSGLESFRIGGPRPIDEKKLDFQNAFLDVGTGGEQNWATLRVGIQELEYGSGRLIDVREGPNVRLSFIGFRILSKLGSWRIDGFAVDRGRTTSDSSTTCPTTKSDFGECTRGGPYPEEFRLMPITLVLIARRLLIRGVQRLSLGKAWEQGSGVRLQTRSQVGTSITKACGNSAALDQQTSAHGLSHQTMATQSQRGGSGRGSA